MQGVCMRDCGVKYVSKTSCNNDEHCMWDDIRNICSPKCGQLTSFVECVDHDSCQWRAITKVTGTCNQPCNYLYIGVAAKGACLADRGCEWNSARLECTKSCSYYETVYNESLAKIECNQDSLCNWNATLPETQRCIKKCPGHQDETACKNDLTRRCMWDAVAQACTSFCPDISTKEECEIRSSSCTWKTPSYTPCNFQCNLRTSNQVSCDSQTDCMWDQSSRSCRKACEEYGDQQKCGAQDMCQWRDGPPSRCVRRCHLIKTYDKCASDSQCEYIGSTDVCQQKCEFAFQGEMACSTSGRCMWDATAGACRNDCGNVALKQCNTISQCMVESDGTCKRKCETRHLSSTECNLDTTCTWDSQRGLCVRACVTAATAAECQINPMCVWQPGASTCKLQCEYRHRNASSCSVDTDCFWDSINGLCRIACGGSATETACKAKIGCTWSGGTCKLECRFRHKTEETCEPDPECFWDFYRNYCGPECDQIHLAELCQAATGQCVWSSLQCKRSCKFRWIEYEDCIDDPECQFNEEFLVCGAACTTFVKAEVCTGDCRWYEKPNSCKTTCSESDAEQCEDLEKSGYCEAESDGACVDTCGVTFFTEATCEGSGRCMWDAIHRSCLRDCRQMSRIPDGTSPVAACNAVPMCLYNATNIVNEIERCQRKCLYRYKSESACSQNENCMWDPITRTCSTSCESEKNEGSCHSNQMCEWNIYNYVGKCRKQCSYRYNNRIDCQADAECYWEETERVCEIACSRISTQVECEDAKACEFNTFTNKCQLPCRLKWQGNANGCSSDPNCMWNDVERECRKVCEQATSLQLCRADSLCLVRPDQKCYRLCRLKYQTADPCSADRFCMWDYSTTKMCKDGCHIWGNAGDCENEDMCSWNAEKYVCEKECPFERQSECTADSRCIWIQESLNKGAYICKRKCETRYTDRVKCDLDDQCMTNVKDNKCVAQCETLDVNTCVTVKEMCEVVGTQCKSLCIYRYTNSIDCNADKDCLWDTGSGICVTMCSRAPSTAACDALEPCVWYKGSCDKICQYKYSTPETCNSVPDRCMWHNQGGYCRNICDNHMTKLECQADSFCEWDDTKKLCDERCALSHYGDPTGCKADPRCMFNFMSKTCATACTRITAQFVCETQPEMCEWDSLTQQCFMQCSFKSETKSACELLPRCVWDVVRNNCRRACSESKSQESCMQSPGCDWFGGLCQPECEQFTETSCANYADRCRFYKSAGAVTKASGCFKQCELKYKQDNICGADAYCIWDYIKNTCVDECWPINRETYPSLTLAQLQQKCTSNYICIWEPTLTKCRNQCNMDHFTEADCNTDADCIWDATIGTCRRQCGLLSTQPLCVQNPNCQWYPTNNICRRQCKDLYFNRSTCEIDPYCDWNPSTSICTTDCTKHPDRLTCTANPVCSWQEKQHVYFWYNSAISWSSAYSDCRTHSYSSRQGYLATATNGVENRLIRDVIRSSSWLGANDAQVDGTWKWVSGPDGSSYNDKGVTFYTGGACQTWCSWSSGQPRSYGWYDDGNYWDCPDRQWYWYSWWYWHWTCKRAENYMLINVDGGWRSYWGALGAPYVCEFGSLDEGQCDKRCEYKYYHQVACDADYTCMWDINTGECETNCNQLNTKNLCNAQPSVCFWDTKGLRCEMQCEYRAKEETDCTDNSFCMWHYDNNICRRHCSFRESRADCNMDDWCYWDANNNKCRKLCERDTNAECLQDSDTCDLRVPENPNEAKFCLSKCIIRHTTAEKCLNDPHEDCMWDELEGKCIDRCNVLAIAVCEKEDMCEIIHSPDRCTRKCLFRHYNVEECNADASCMWDPDRGRCVDHCSRFTAASECDNSYMCQWVVDFRTGTDTKPTCIKRCNYRYNGTAQKALCNGDEFCEFSDATGKCDNVCYKHTKYHPRRKRRRDGLHGRQLLFVHF